MSKRAKRPAIALGVAIAVAAIASVSVYYYNEGRNENGRKKYQPRSKCYILTEDVYDKVHDWEEELSNDTVILVAPGSHLSGNRLKTSYPKYAHKIIICSNWKAIWACVRHLRKQELLIDTEEIPENIPRDISLYTKEIITI